MKWFEKRKKPEIRADTERLSVDDPVLRALFGGGEVTREMALQVPTVSGGIDLIAGIIAGTPIKLYQDTPGKKAVEVLDDPRSRLLNDETGDTLDANQFWRAVARDYYLGKGGYAYINKNRGKIKSLHYVEEQRVSVLKNADPIFKDFDLMVNGATYHPFEFLKILRNTPDGAQGVPITAESAKLIEAAYHSLLLENSLAKKGGNKRGFLKAKQKVSQPVLDGLKQAFMGLYSNSSESVVVLNDGLEFQESSNTSVELQLNENKIANAGEFAKIFHISIGAMSGAASEQDIASLAKLAAIPLMKTIECALNRDFLLENEKGRLYWAFDVKELMKGGIKERYDAYKTALEANFLGIDEVRYMEDMEPLGLSWIRLGLQDVLYDPKTKLLYTPNTNSMNRMEAGSLPKPANEPPELPNGETEEKKRRGRRN